MLLPGARPVVTSANSLASVKAAERLLASAVLEPIALGDDMKEANDQIADTVVTSLTTNEVGRLPQGPRAAIRTLAVLFVPATSPGLPPDAVTYTREEGDGHVYAPVNEKVPAASLVIG